MATIRLSGAKPVERINESPDAERAEIPPDEEFRQKHFGGSTFHLLEKGVGAMRQRKRSLP